MSPPQVKPPPAPQDQPSTEYQPWEGNAVKLYSETSGFHPAGLAWGGIGSDFVAGIRDAQYLVYIADWFADGAASPLGDTIKGLLAGQVKDKKKTDLLIAIHTWNHVGGASRNPAAAEAGSLTLKKSQVGDELTGWAHHPKFLVVDSARRDDSGVLQAGQRNLTVFFRGFDLSGGAGSGRQNLHVRLTGPAAWDFAREFAGRWASAAGGGTNTPKAKLDGLSSNGQLLAPQQGSPPSSAARPFRAQLLRSRQTIDVAYLQNIATAEKFVYLMETRYLLGAATGADSEATDARIGDALVQRILDRRKRKLPFHAYVVVPLFPKVGKVQQTEPTADGYVAVPTFRLETVRSMVKQLYGVMKDDWQNYLSFYSLASWLPATAGAEKAPTGAVASYVRSRLLICDDTALILGSGSEPRIAAPAKPAGAAAPSAPVAAGKPAPSDAKATAAAEQPASPNAGAELCLGLWWNKGAAHDATMQKFRGALWRELLAGNVVGKWRDPSSAACVRDVKKSARSSAQLRFWPFRWAAGELALAEAEKQK